MNTNPQITSAINSVLANRGNYEPRGKGESKGDRVGRLYRAEGGPLLGRLIEEANFREHDTQAMANALGVTSGYVKQLQSGSRATDSISTAFADACARYLGYPTIVVKLLAGVISMRDFLQPQVSEEVVIERGIRAMMNDSKYRDCLPSLSDVCAMSQEAKRALVWIYAETSGNDVFGTHRLPNILSWLQRAATIHDESMYEAVAGDRDTLSRAS